MDLFSFIFFKGRIANLKILFSSCLLPYHNLLYFISSNFKYYHIIPKPLSSYEFHMFLWILSFVWYLNIKSVNILVLLTYYPINFQNVNNLRMMRRWRAHRKRLGLSNNSKLKRVYAWSWFNAHTDIKMSNIQCGHVKIHYDEVKRKKVCGNLTSHQI